MQKTHKASMMLGNKELKLDFGTLAPKATVSVLATMGGTAVLTTVVSGRESNLGYFPLSVEYAEKLYAGGIIKGSRWVKREGRPTDEAVLKGRVIDRSIRPLFSKGYKKEVQVICTPLAIDAEVPADMIAAISASAALHVSSIPWKGPISTVRMGWKASEKADGTGEFILNPTLAEMEASPLDLVVSSNNDKVVMIETQAMELPEALIAEGIEKSRLVNQKVISFIEEIRKVIGQDKESFEEDPILVKAKELMKKDAAQIAILAEKDAHKDADFGEMSTAFLNDIYEKLGEEFDKKKLNDVLETVMHDKIKDDVIQHGKRYDGRKLDEIRPLTAMNSLLPRVHGSGLFQRGLTQVMSIVTLGPTSLEQLIETPEGESTKRYIHHYSSPPYSYGEAGRFGFPGRREIGHGALAEKAIEPVLPSKEEFPYAIRVVSEVLSSNGSTSMASTCGSSLALMDAGVPLKAQVAGISIGLMWESDEKYTLLTDIAGIEDFSGFMDFKVAGTEKGVTAIQLDVKNEGLTEKMIKETFERAKTARTFILETMNKVISKPKAEVSEFAPKVVLLTPPEDKIGEIIGPGGKNIKRIIADTGAQIDIDDKGMVSISGVRHEDVEAAVAAVKSVYREIKPGETFTGEVVKVLPIGAIVEFLPNKSGLVHVSKLAKEFVKDPRDVVSEGDMIDIKVMEVDSQGRYNLARVFKD